MTTRRRAAAARREAARAAFYGRAPELVAADLARLTELLERRARWIFARTLADNPHSYTLRREWHDADFVWVVETIRAIGDRERWPDVPGAFVYDVLNLNGRKYWTSGVFGSGGPINMRDGRPATLLINRKPAFCEGDRR